METEKISNWLSILANFSVLAGIIFLAIEIGQNNELMNSEARYNRAQNRINANLQLVNSPILLSAISKAGSGLTAEELVALQRFAISNFVSWQLTYEDYDAGLLEEVDLPVLGWQSVMTNSDTYRQEWTKFAAANLRSDFVSWFELNVLSN